METTFKKIDKKTALQLIGAGTQIYKERFPGLYSPVNCGYLLPDCNLYVPQEVETHFNKPPSKITRIYSEIPKYKVIKYIAQDIPVFTLDYAKRYVPVTSLEELKNDLFYIQEQKTIILVNGTEVEAPLVKDRINKNFTYYVASLTRNNNYFQISGSSNFLDFYLNKNMVFETAETAQKYVKALLNHSS